MGYDSINGNNCKICGSLNKEELFISGNYPYFTSPVSKTDKNLILKKYSISELESELSYWTCKECGHYFIKNIPNQKIIDSLYKNYYSYPSPLQNNIEPVRDNEFFEYFKNNILNLCISNNLNNVLEVGCFDGYILKKLKQIGFNVTGCDPSDGAKIGKSFGIEIINEFFNHKIIKKLKNDFDILISRHFIEHVIDPHKYILEFSEVIKNEGLLILETPNISYNIKNGVSGVFSLQHISLYSYTSLEYLLNLCGFQITLSYDGAENLIVVAKKSKNVIVNNTNEKINFLKYKKNYVDILISNKKKFNDILDKYNNICIWGAGGACISAISLFGVPINKILYIIDSDQNKWGMEYLDYTIKIISPSMAELELPSLIIITSMYEKTIISSMPEKLNQLPKLLMYPKIELI